MTRRNFRDKIGLSAGEQWLPVHKIEGECRMRDNRIVYQLTDEDIRAVIEDKYPLLTDNEVEKAIQVAIDKFTIHDWSEQVDDFIAVFMETHIRDDSE